MDGGEIKLAAYERILNLGGSDSCSELRDAVREKGPVAVGVDASGWINYESGVF
jgi:hypothetical protein